MYDILKMLCIKYPRLYRFVIRDIYTFKESMNVNVIQKCIFFLQEICHAIACPQEVRGEKIPWFVPSPNWKVAKRITLGDNAQQTTFNMETLVYIMYTLSVYNSFGTIWEKNLGCKIKPESVWKEDWFLMFKSMLPMASRPAARLFFFCKKAPGSVISRADYLCSDQIANLVSPKQVWTKFCIQNIFQFKLSTVKKKQQQASSVGM